MWVTVVGGVVIACFISMMVQRSPRGQVIDVPLSAAEAAETIFIGVIVHPGEESDCARMLHTLFENATAVNRLRVGVLHYVAAEDRQGGGVGIASYFANVRSQYDRICVEQGTRRQSFKVIRRNAEGDQGLEVSRAEMKCKLFANEKYWCEALPIHRFCARWDTNAVECLRMGGSRAILTTEPGDVFTSQVTYPVVISGTLDEFRFPQVAPKVYAETPSQPYEVPLLSPSFVFCKSSVILECPPDPRFTFCDTADVLLRSARLSTRGYSFFAPHRLLLQRHRASPIDSDDHRQLTPTTATTAEARRVRTNGMRAALSVLGEDLCNVCGEKRSEHVTSTALNHPFEAKNGSLSRRAKVLGSVRTLSAFRSRAGVWVNRRPNMYAANGILRRAGEQERKEKNFYPNRRPEADFA